MTITRIYQPIPMQIATVVRLTENASHHLARVLRIKVGEQITIFNGEGGEYLAAIVGMGKKYVEVEVLSFTPREVESNLNLHLAQGIAKGEKMDFIVQKAVELGVNKIIPLMTERCTVRLPPDREEKRLLHWQSIIISACEQSGRNRVPEIVAPQTFKQWLAVQHAGLGLILSPHAQNKMLLPLGVATTPITLLIGPEGGLSATEIEAACAQDFVALNLGQRILRTETATIAGLVALQCRYGDF